jgi:uncharacterized Ntn-hydrolase superfamily protein
MSPSKALFVVAVAGVAAIAARTPVSADRLAYTFSIVARDQATGEMGVAVQSHAFSVGSIVTWGEAGVGVVATQSLVDPGYGMRGLELMRGGTPAPDALRQLIAADQHPDGRQVAMLDATGRVDAFTGKKAIAAAGHHVGNEYSAQANLMANDRVWPAMSDAYEHTQGDLAERLLAALDAAQAAGGDIRGKESAAILVVRGKSSGRPWAGADRVYDLRVDDHPEPIKELRRLVNMQRAMNHSSRCDELMTEGRVPEALEECSAATRLLPDFPELRFWHAVTLASVGRESDAAAIFRELFRAQPFWADLLRRLPASGLFPDDPALMERMQALAPPSQKR